MQGIQGIQGIQGNDGADGDGSIVVAPANVYTDAAPAVIYTSELAGSTQGASDIVRTIMGELESYIGTISFTTDTPLPAPAGANELLIPIPGAPPAPNSGTQAFIPAVMFSGAGSQNLEFLYAYIDGTPYLRINMEKITLVQATAYAVKFHGFILNV